MNVLGRVEELVGGLLEMPGSVPKEVPLLDLGADSLVLIELSHRVEQDFGVAISVQQLFEDVVTVDAVAHWIEQESPAAVPDPADGPRVPEQITAAVEQSAVRHDESRSPRTYVEATAESRRLSELYQGVLCNNRRIAERDAAERESAYPIWVAKSDGPYFWDEDGNRLIDLAMGYGAHIFGHKSRLCDAGAARAARTRHPPRR